jgi:putative glutamine amidotransferase
LRDAGELALVRAALSNDLPLLAVCRGCQVLNVALGGTLHQHLPDLPWAHAHSRRRGKSAPDDHPGFAIHAVRLAPDDPLARVLGRTVTVPSSHHQAVDSLGQGLLPIGWSDDGMIEAIRLVGREFVVGVQWHPEFQGGWALFSELVRAARARSFQIASAGDGAVW